VIAISSVFAFDYCSSHLSILGCHSYSQHFVSRVFFCLNRQLRRETAHTVLVSEHARLHNTHTRCVATQRRLGDERASLAARVTAADEREAALERIKLGRCSHFCLYQIITGVCYQPLTLLFVLLYFSLGDIASVVAVNRQVASSLDALTYQSLTLIIFIFPFYLS
jgi:hypothetical protein